VSDDLVAISGLVVCASCRQRLMNKLREGIKPTVIAAGNGPWRQGDELVVSTEGVLPERCFKCGEPPVKRVCQRLTWHHPALYILFFVSFPLYIIVALIVQKYATFHIPVCGPCNSRRVRNFVIGYGSFFVGAGLFLAAFSLAGWTSYDTLSDGLCIGGLVLIIFSLFWAVGVEFIRAKKITDPFVWISKAGKEVLEPLPAFPQNANDVTPA
jgi:hypothetical protein